MTCPQASPRPSVSLPPGRYTVKAVVVSSVAALTEIVSDGTTGLVFEKGSAAALADVLERLVDDPELRTKLGESARTWVRNERDWSSLVEIVAATYAEILA